METTFQKIMRKTGRKPVQCKCQDCKRQCKTPCLGTPEDVEKLIEAGYINRLGVYDWDFGRMFGSIDRSIEMVQAKQNATGCTFFKDGLCELHESGLKPTEGKLSHHSTSLATFKFSKSVSWNVAKEWISPENEETVERIFNKIKVYVTEY